MDGYATLQELRVCARQNFLDDPSLGIGIGLNIFPFPLCQAPFGAFVKIAVGGIVAQPVPESQNAIDFCTSRGINVQVDVRAWSFEHPVLVPMGFSYP